MEVDLGPCEWFLLSIPHKQFGGLYFEEVENTSVSCRVLEGVECHGNRSFTKTNVPCLRYASFSASHTQPTLVEHNPR